MAFDLNKYFQLKNANAPQFTDNGNGGYVDASGNTFNSEDMGTALNSARLQNEQGASDYVNQNGGISALAAALKGQVNQQFAGKPPSIEQSIANWQVDHFLKYGQTIDRPWTADAEASNQGQALINGYKQELAQYNAQNGTNLQPTVNSVGELPVDAYAASRPSDHKGTGGFGGLIKGAMQSPLGGLMLAMAGGPMGMFGGPGAFVGEGAGLVGGGAGVGTLIGGTASGADTLGLQQMAADAGLTGQAASDFVSSGGTLGSTAAGGTLNGSNWIDKSINDGSLPNTPGSGKAIPQTDSWNDYFDAASRNANASMPTTGNKLVDQALTKAASLALTSGAGAANQATGGTGGDTTAADQQAADEARKQQLIEQINAMYDPNNFADEEGKLSDAIRGQQGDALKLGYDKAARATTFDAARRGNVGGSVMADNIAGLNRDNQLGGTKIEDAVNSALSGLRSSRLSSQNNAISLVNAGSGPEAVSAAATGIKNAIDTAQAAKVPDVTQGLFQNVALSNQAINTGNNTAALGAYINARTSGGGSLFPLGSRSAGYSVPT